MRKFGSMKIGQTFIYYKNTTNGIFGFEAEKLSHNSAVVFMENETIVNIDPNLKFELGSDNDEWNREIAMQNRMLGDF